MEHWETSINALGVSHDKSASQIGVAEHLNGTVPPRRPTNADLRAREYLTEAEIERLIKAARTGRYAQRDPIQLATIQGPRSSLARRPCLNAIRISVASRQRNTTGAFVFETERGGPFTAGAINRLIKRIGERAHFDFMVHAHMLRHACGYALANRGHDTRALQAYLGHKNIQHTVRYTELSPTRFKDFWRNTTPPR